MYLIIDSYHKENQSTIENILTRYPRRRDYISRTPRTGPILSVFLMVANYLNKTLVSKQSLKELSLNSSSYYSVVVPGMYISERYNETIKYFQKNGGAGAVESPQFIPPYMIAYNFAYCHTQRNKKESAFNFVVFTDSFDNCTWLVLLLSFSFVCFLCCEYSNKGVLSAAAAAWPAILSTLISAGGPSNITKKLKYSPLFVVWMKCNFVLVNFYSGSITSLLIIPPPDDTINTILDLKNRNYRLIFNKNHGKSRFKDFVSSQGNFSKYSKILGHLANAASEVENLQTTLANVDNVATMRSWRVCLTDALAASEILKREKVSNRQCYVGKELLPSARQYYYGFYPPGSVAVSRMFQWIVEVGIYSYWYNELHGLLIAKRVQDRVKVKGSQLNHGNSNLASSLPKPLKMQGKIMAIFCLWGVCLLVCFVTFLFEVLYLKSLA